MKTSSFYKYCVGGDVTKAFEGLAKAVSQSGAPASSKTVATKEGGETMKPVFDLAVDRTRSLLERWQNFYDKAAKDHYTDEAIQILQDKCLLGLMSELSDPFTQSLIEEVNKRISTDAQ